MRRTAGDNAEVQEMTTLYMEKVRNLCLPEFMCAVDAEALKDLELAADAAAAHATLTQPLAGAKAVKSGDQSDTVTPRPLVELRKLMGADGLKNLLRTGDTMDFSEAALRVAEVNAVQKRWSVNLNLLCDPCGRFNPRAGELVAFASCFDGQRSSSSGCGAVHPSLVRGCSGSAQRWLDGRVRRRRTTPMFVC